MSRIFSLLLCAVIITLSPPIYAQNNLPVKQLKDSAFHVYLLIGQSNMAGRGALDSARREPDPRILMLDSTNQWSSAKHPLHFDRSYAGVGPGISFAETMLQENPDHKIGLVPSAWGGSPIRVWQPGAQYFDNFPYDEAVARARIAMQKGVLKGVLWHQGESDNTPEKAAVYLEKLKTLVENLRKNLNAPNLPFVAGEVGYFNKKDHINAIIKQTDEEIPHSAVVSAEGLKDKGDQLHFSTPSAGELGKRYGEAMKILHNEAEESEKRPTVVLTFDDAEISHYTFVAPLLLEYGFPATFFVGEFPLNSPEEKDQYMSWNQILALHKMGFEIGNHTGHHKNVTKLSRKELEEEITYLDSKLSELGIPTPTSFAYPGNRNDSTSHVVLEEMGYKIARAGGSRLYDPENDKNMVIPSYTTSSSEKLRSRVTKALEEMKPGDYMVFTFHGVPDLIHPDYSTSPEFLRELLEYIKDHEYRVISMRELSLEEKHN